MTSGFRKVVDELSRHDARGSWSNRRNRCTLAPHPGKKIVRLLGANRGVAAPAREMNSWVVAEGNSRLLDGILRQVVKLADRSSLHDWLLHCVARRNATPESAARPAEPIQPLLPKPIFGS